MMEKVAAVSWNSLKRNNFLIEFELHLKDPVLGPDGFSFTQPIHALEMSIIVFGFFLKRIF